METLSPARLTRASWRSLASSLTKATCAFSSAVSRRALWVNLSQLSLLSYFMWRGAETDWTHFMAREVLRRLSSISGGDDVSSPRAAFQVRRWGLSQKVLFAVLYCILACQRYFACPMPFLSIEIRLADVCFVPNSECAEARCSLRLKRPRVLIVDISQPSSEPCLARTRQSPISMLGTSVGLADASNC